MTFPLAVLEYKMGLMKTIIYTNIGGLAGILFFHYLFEKLIIIWRHYTKNRSFRLLPNKGAKKEKKIFTKRNRRIVRLKSKYGLAGIAILTPLIFSIPLGTFLVTRYFSHQKMKLVYLATANLAWSVIYTLFYLFFFDLYFELFSP